MATGMAPETAKAPALRPEAAVARSRPAAAAAATGRAGSAPGSVSPAARQCGDSNEANRSSGPLKFPAASRIGGIVGRCCASVCSSAASNASRFRGVFSRRDATDSTITGPANRTMLGRATRTAGPRRRPPPPHPAAGLPRQSSLGDRPHGHIDQRVGTGQAARHSGAATRYLFCQRLETAGIGHPVAKQRTGTRRVVPQSLRTNGARISRSVTDRTLDAGRSAARSLGLTPGFTATGCLKSLRMGTLLQGCIGAIAFGQNAIGGHETHCVGGPPARAGAAVRPDGFPLCWGPTGQASAAARPDGSHKAEARRVKRHQAGFLLPRNVAGHGDQHETLCEPCLPLPSAL